MRVEQPPAVADAESGTDTRIRENRVRIRRNRVRAHRDEHCAGQLLRVPPGVSPIGSGTILSRIWNKPSITVTGIDAPSVRNASNTLSPEVSVVISARVAPGQSAEEAYQAIEAHLRAHAPFGAQLSFRDIETGNPFLVDTSGDAVAHARATLAEG